jgi:antibiotic biosynthesis monooxygenase (ABM) superfamily enzyme
LTWHQDSFYIFPVGNGWELEVNEFDFKDDGSFVMGGRLPEHSPQRSKSMSRMIGLSEHTTPLKNLSGLEIWFTLSTGQAIFPPPRYKMVIVIWLAVFSLNTLLSFAMSYVVRILPPVLHALVATLILVALMTYVVMPHMT